MYYYILIACLRVKCVRTHWSVAARCADRSLDVNETAWQARAFSLRNPKEMVRTQKWLESQVGRLS